MVHGLRGEMDVGNELAELDQLAQRINLAHNNFEMTFRLSLEHAKEAGDLLSEAKKRVDHGNWLTWLRGNCPRSVNMAPKYMKISRDWLRIEAANKERVTGLGIKEALKLVAKHKKAPFDAVTIDGIAVERNIPPSLPSLSHVSRTTSLKVDHLLNQLVSLVRQMGHAEREEAIRKTEFSLKQIKDRSKPIGFMTVAEINRKFFKNTVRDAELSEALAKLGKAGNVRSLEWQDPRGVMLDVYPEALAMKLQSIANANGWPVSSLGDAYNQHVEYADMPVRFDASSPAFSQEAVI